VGKKKSKKDKGKKSTKQDKKSKNRRSILGASARDIGTALVGAAVGEIAQSVISRTADKTASSKQLDNIRSAIEDGTTNVKHAVADTVESVGDAVKATQDDADSTGSSINNVINRVAERVEELRQQANDTVSENLGLPESVGKNGKHEKKKDKKS